MVTPEQGLILTLGGVGLCLGYLASDEQFRVSLTSRIRQRKAKHDQRLRFLRSRIAAAWVMAFEALMLALGILGVFMATWPLVVAAAVLVVLPNFYLEREYVERSRRIHLQVEGFLNALGRAFCAAPSLSDALGSARSALRGPLADEVGEVLEEFHIGVPIEKALSNMASRVQSENLRVAVLTLTLGARSGGRLEHVLLSTANSMREMERLDGVLRAKTAEGKAQTLVISLLPPPVLGAIEWLSPGFFAPLDASFSGHVLVAIALGLWAGAVVLARQILAVDL
jgi:tight adherence protein B